MSFGEYDDVFQRSRLVGKKVLLVSEVPEAIGTEQEDAQNNYVRLEEAVTSLARAVFVERGQLIFWGDAELSMLLVHIVGDYLYPRFAEGSSAANERPGEPSGASLQLYLPLQSAEWFKDSLELAHEAGYTTVQWGSEPVQIVRETRPDLLVCMGGRGDRLIQAIREFRELRSHEQIVTIATTGGTAGQLAEREDIRAFDQEFQYRLTRSTQDSPEYAEELHQRLLPPYPVIMQELIRQFSS